MDAVYNWALATTEYSKYAQVLKNAAIGHKSMIREDIVNDLVSLTDHNGRPVFALTTAKDLVSAYRDTLHEGGIAIYWDIENVPPPLGHKASDAALTLRKHLADSYGNILEFKVYCDTKSSQRGETDWVGLNDAGIDVVHACHMNRKEVADKMIIVDAIWFALSKRLATPNMSNTESKRINPTICIISGDSDFSPMLSKLGMNGFHTVSITGSSHNVRSVNKQAAEHFTWADLIPPTGGHAETRPRNVAKPANPPPPSYAPQPPMPQQPQQRPKPSDEAPAVVSAADGEDRHHPLRQSILAVIEKFGCQDDGGKVLKSQVGAEYSKRNFLKIPFADAVRAALDDGVIEDSGTGGSAWIALRQRDVYLFVTGPADLIPEALNKKFRNKICKEVKLPVCGQILRRVVYGPFRSADELRKAITEEGGLDMADCSVTLLGAQSPDVIDVYRIDDQEETIPSSRDLTSRFATNKGFESLFLNPEKSVRTCIFGASCSLGSSCHFLHQK